MTSVLTPRPINFPLALVIDTSGLTSREEQLSSCHPPPPFKKKKKKKKKKPGVWQIAGESPCSHLKHREIAMEPPEVRLTQQVSLMRKGHKRFQNQLQKVWEPLLLTPVLHNEGHLHPGQHPHLVEHALHHVKWGKGVDLKMIPRV